MADSNGNLVRILIDQNTVFSGRCFPYSIDVGPYVICSIANRRIFYFTGQVVLADPSLIVPGDLKCKNIPLSQFTAFDRLITCKSDTVFCLVSVDEV